MARPDVTVILPVRDGMPYLPAAVSSILQQSIADMLLFIVDDGSDDDTPKFLASLGDHRVRLFKTHHAGPGGAFNHALAHVETEFLARMDADDISLPDRLDRQLSLLQSRPGVGLVGTQISYFSRDPSRERFHSSLPTESAGIRFALLRGEHAICNPTILCRTELVQRIGGYRILSAGEDWDFFVRLGEGTELANLRAVLHRYRLHTRNLSTIRWDLVLRGIRYATACAQARREGRPEPDLSEFVRHYERRPHWTRMWDAIEKVAMAHYRAGLVDLLEGRTLRGGGRLMLSCLLGPRKVLLRLRNRRARFC